MKSKSPFDPKIRLWSEFIDGFSAPENLPERIQDNLQYFAVNYLAVSGVLLALSSYLNPPVLLLIIVVAISIIILHFGPEFWSDYTTFNPKLMEKAIIVGIESLIVVHWLDLYRSLLWFSFWAVAGIIAHASFKSRSIKNKATNIANTIGTNLNEKIKKKF